MQLFSPGQSLIPVILHRNKGRSREKHPIEGENDGVLVYSTVLLPLENISCLFAGGSEIYSCNSDADFQVESISSVISGDQDEGIDATILSSGVDSFADLAERTLNDAHDQEIADQYLLFGQRFQQRLTTLV